MKAKTARPKYRLIVGLSWVLDPNVAQRIADGDVPEEIIWGRGEPGDIVDNLLPNSIKTLLDEGKIELVSADEDDD